MCFCYKFKLGPWESNELYDSLQVDAALIATGRAPFTQGLGLENVSEVEIDIFQLYMQINCQIICNKLFFRLMFKHNVDLSLLMSA